MVEVAHIYPFTASGDDDPRNVIALTLDTHWAMDRDLIASGPGWRWQVSRLMDDRVADLQRLVALEGRPLLLLEQCTMWLREPALAWCVDGLHDVGWRVPLTG